MGNDWESIQRQRGDLERRRIELENAAATGSLPADVIAQQADTLGRDLAALSHRGRSANEINAENVAAETRREEERLARAIESQWRTGDAHIEAIRLEGFRVLEEAKRFLSKTPPPASFSRGIQLLATVHWVAPETGYVWLTAEHDGVTLKNLVIVSDPLRRVHYEVGQAVVVYVLHLRNLERDRHRIMDPARWKDFYTSVAVGVEATFQVGQVLPAVVVKGAPKFSTLRIEMPDGSVREIGVSHVEHRAALWGFRNKPGTRTTVTVSAMYLSGSPGLSVGYAHTLGAKFT